MGRGSSHLSGVRRVVSNFLTGLERKGVPYRYNPLPLLRGQQPVISFGLGQMGLKGVSPKTPLIAAVGFPYPADFPDLCERYDVRYFLQHSKWVLDLLKSPGVYDPSVFATWPAGVDTDEWSPIKRAKSVDVIVYQKIHWDKAGWATRLVQPVLDALVSRGLSSTEVVYGQYTPEQYKDQLSEARALVFLSAHESQGLAYLEAMSFGLPVFAWEPGFWLDPDQKRLGLSQVPATSVPFFDARCGSTFKDAVEFEANFDAFWEAVQASHLAPRDYVLENVSIERSTEEMLAYYDDL